MSGTLPAVVLGGYLGAGKTTLVNHLLRHAAGRRIAVMVNDFGEIGIDADLIESRNGDVLNLAGGCICCSVGSDLIEALVGLPGRASPPELVLIETSGVALPGSVARSVRLAPGIEVDGVVVLVDAETIRTRAVDPYVGDTVLQQLADADLLVLNKVDLVPHEALPALRAWLDAAAPRARRIEATEAQVPVELVLGPMDPGNDAGVDASAAVVGEAAAGRREDTSGPAPQRASRGASRGPLATAAAGAGGGPLRAASNAADVFETASFRVHGPVDAAALAARLADPALALVRAKGIVVDRDGSTVVVQAVGARTRVTPAPDAAARSAPGRLVAIGLRDRFDAGAVRAAIAASTSAP